MSFLDELLTSTRKRVAEARALTSDDALEQRVASISPALDLRAAIHRDEVSVIAEIKRATPSAGDLNVDLDAASLAMAYQNGGAAAISVLTEPERFKGSLEDLAAAKTSDLPVLRKDFVVDPFQIYEARAWGADACLLIVRILGPELGELIALTRSLGMAALVEVFSSEDVDRALAAGAEVIGVNHRDLETFEVDAERTAKLAPSLPQGTTLVGLSGVTTRAEVETLGEAGAHAVLVGEALVTAADPSAKLKELRGAA